MDEQKLIDEEMASILDLLEQIKSVNKMINFHKNKSRDSSMVHQYEDIRQRFLVELKEILKGFEIVLLSHKKHPKHLGIYLKPFQ